MFLMTWCPRIVTYYVRVLFFESNHGILQRPDNRVNGSRPLRI